MSDSNGRNPYASHKDFSGSHGSPPEAQLFQKFVKLFFLQSASWTAALAIFSALYVLSFSVSFPFQNSMIMLAAHASLTLCCIQVVFFLASIVFSFIHGVGKIQFYGLTGALAAIIVFYNLGYVWGIKF